jgi:hypothetical protein
MHIMWCGPVGSGKTYNAIADIVKDAGDFVVAPHGLVNIEALNAAIESLPRRDALEMFLRADGSFHWDGDGKALQEFRDLNDESAVAARCGTWFLDEAPMWLDARKFDALLPEARRKLLEHRKDDLLIISTAQDVSLIDKIFRLLADEIRVVRQSGFPFIGWFWPTCVRPTIICRHCGRVRRDGYGDDRGWRKRLGFGTFYMWDTFKAKDLIDAQDPTGEAIEPKKIGSGMRLFDVRIAAAYDTSKKLSEVATKALEARRRSAYRRAAPPQAARPQNALPLEQPF